LSDPRLVGGARRDHNPTMNLNSKYFDRIRINPGGQRVEDAEAPPCEWRGCGRGGGYRAPKGRMREGEYHNFCLDHVREYNKSYNYFAGMADDDVAAYQRSASTGHRPTWTMGVNRAKGSAPAGNGHAWTAGFSDPFGIFGGAFRRHEAQSEPAKRPLKHLEQRSFRVLDLDGNETGAEIKARYKSLVKLLHPDANGGDRSSEDRLRQIIQAYHYLRSVGFC
jgi:curved DNA-binding protein CbpA